MEIPAPVVSRESDTRVEGLFAMQQASIRPRDALAGVPWLRSCGDAVLDQLAAGATLEHVADGASVAWRGRQTTHLLVIAHGALELSMTSAEGKRHVINRLSPGQVFGLIPLLDESALIHDAVARGASEIVHVPQSVFRAAMRDHPNLNDQVIRLLCARARRLYEALAAQSLTTLPVRLARVLLGQRQQTADEAIAMAQADLADMLGVTRQSLNVELKRLEREGMVAIGRSRIELRDLARLERLAGSAD
jgi:CRP/FNR family transcriptional regulator, cyclic AMP receptor protein